MFISDVGWSKQKDGTSFTPLICIIEPKSFTIRFVEKKIEIVHPHLKIFILERIFHQSIPCLLKSSLQFGIFVQFKISDHFLIEGKECCASRIGNGRCLPSPIVGDLDSFSIHLRHLNRPVWVPHTQFEQQHVPHFEGRT